MQSQLPNTHSQPHPSQSHPHNTQHTSPPIQVKLETPPRPQAIYLSCTPAVLSFIMLTTRQLCHKYLDNTEDTTIQSILRGVQLIGQNLTRIRGVKQLLAAVLYSQYPSSIRLRLKDFSSMNQLIPKLFYRRYMIYQKIIKKQTCRQSPEQIDKYQNQIKIEEQSCKSEQCSQKEEEENDTRQRLPSFSSSYSHLHPLSISSPKQAIQLIYDGIFKSSSLQQSRRQMITKMSDLCCQIPPQIYDLMTWTTSKTIKLFYAVYARLKRLGMNVSFTKYREAVEYAAGYQLKRAHALSTEKIMGKIMVEELDEIWSNHTQQAGQQVQS